MTRNINYKTMSVRTIEHAITDFMVEHAERNEDNEFEIRINGRRRSRANFNGAYIEDILESFDAISKYDEYYACCYGYSVDVSEYMNDYYN